MDGLVENPIKMDYLVVPLFLVTPIFGRLGTNGLEFQVIHPRNLTCRYQK